MTEPSAAAPSLKSRLAEELRRYLLISLYLFICFGIILLYEASQSATKDAGLITVTAALVKALVIGKFLLIGEALRPGSRMDAPTLLHRVAWKTIGMMIVLAVFKLIEELIIGLVHGTGVSETIDELLKEPWIALIAPMLLMLLILIPLMTAIELQRALGTDGLRGLLLGAEDQQ